MSLKNQFNKLSNYHLIKLIKQIVAINKIIMRLRMMLMMNLWII